MVVALQHACELLDVPSISDEISEIVLAPCDPLERISARQKPHADSESVHFPPLLAYCAKARQIALSNPAISTVQALGAPIRARLPRFLGCLWYSPRFWQPRSLTAQIRLYRMTDWHTESVRAKGPLFTTKRALCVVVDMHVFWSQMCCLRLEKWVGTLDAGDRLVS